MRGGRPTSVLLASIGAAVAGLGITVRAQGETLSPSGRRENRVYGASNIKRYLQRQKRTWGAAGSIAGHPHEHERERLRNLRQRHAVNENRIARAEPEAARNGFGRSRRGRLIDCVPVMMP